MGMGIGFVTIIIVGLSYLGCMGAGAYLGLFNNQLNNNIPFLLLGLGVDDAFVLSAEFMKAATEDRQKKRSVEDYIVDTAKNGGISILITSASYFALCCRSHCFCPPSSLMRAAPSRTDTTVSAASRLRRSILSGKKRAAASAATASQAI